MHGDRDVISDRTVGSVLVGVLTPTSRLVTGKSPHELNQMANAGVVKTGELIRQSPGALLSAAKAFRKP